MSFIIPTLPLHEAGPVFALLLLLVATAPLLARSLRLPDVVVLILAGVAVGPAGLGLLERDGAVALLGSAGLLYLMMLAGLELDLDDFVANRHGSLLFGGLTFIVPLVLGTAVALGLGLALLPAILIGSCWSSHTLLAYPQFRRAGSHGHRVVATTVGATIITDTAALLVLVVVVRADAGALGLSFWATLLPAFGALVALTLWSLPRLARAFFAGPGQDPALRLLFVLVCLFVVSALTALVGVEPLVGAFLAGLALNRSVPNGGALMERVELLGGVLFVPLFLLSTGMLVDLRLLMQPRVLLLGVAFSAVAMVAKLLAAVAAGRLLRASRVEVGAMFSLSNAQAAATLAAVVVGLQAGLLTDEIVSAVIMVILVTCVVSSLVAQRVALRLGVSQRERPLGTVVLAPVANPSTAEGLLRLAASLAQADGGIVVPLVVAPAGSLETDVAERRALLEEATRVAQSAGAEARPVLRVDGSPADGIVHTATESDASLVVVGWQGTSGLHGSRLGGILDLVVGRVVRPTLVIREGDRTPARVVVVIDGLLEGPRAEASLSLALRAATTVARDRRIPLEVLTAGESTDAAAAVFAWTGLTPVQRVGRRSAVVAEVTRPDDILVLPSLADSGSMRVLATRELRAVPRGAAVVVALAHGVRDGASAPSRPTPAAADSDAHQVSTIVLSELHDTDDVVS